MKKPTYHIPANCFGADLVWWRESPSLHTVVTVNGAIEESNGLRPGSLPAVHLECVLFTAEGEFQDSWCAPLPRNGMVAIDSAKRGDTVKSGLLALFVCAAAELPSAVGGKYNRLFSMVDWYSDEGEIASLHSDQSLSARGLNLEFTEIVVLETATQRNYLVVLNGPEPQEPGSVRLEARNRAGQAREAVYAAAMAPFSVHFLHLSELFPGFATYAEGGHVSLSGQFQGRGVFARPYVITEGNSTNAYHGGDRYSWPAIPDLIHRYLGRGEVNPMVAIHQPGLTTTVNVLNSHGSLESDFWVDARLYDRAGHLVAERERWLLARRKHHSRGEIADLLPDSRAPFVGHVALSFSADAKPLYPRRLQALLEYRTPRSVAHVSAWSDIWNGRRKLHELKQQLGPLPLIDKLFPAHYSSSAEVIYHCFYRMWFKPPLVSYIGITNCGIEPDYCKRAPYVLRLSNSRGQSLEFRGDLGPQATDWGRIDTFFTRISDFAGSDAVLMARIESPADLAVMHLTEHQRSGVFSAEHFMASGTYHDGSYHWMCGS